MDLEDQNYHFPCKTPSRQLCSVSQQFTTPHLTSVQKPFQYAQVPQGAFSTPNAPIITFLPQINTYPALEKSACNGKQSASDCPVTVKIDWSTKSKTKVLPDELSSLGKMLCRGTYKQIAKAAWTCEALQKHFLQEIAKQVHKECGALCSKGINKQHKRQQNCCLHINTDKESMLKVSFENLDKQLEQEAPLFHSVLKTAALRKEDKEKAWIPAVGMAAAICLKNRSVDMADAQLLVSDLSTDLLDFW